MKKLVQHIKTGELKLIDVPYPEPKPGFVLVKTLFSAISIGTELGVVSLLKGSLLQKIKQKPEMIKKLHEMVRRYGVQTTKALIATTIDRYMPLGYSLSGKVLVTDEESEFMKGDVVACGGSEYASHQEFAVVPRNLCVKVPEGVSAKIASFTTIGSVAVWGLREAEAVFGERGLVIGLGLIGTIAALLGEFAGIEIYGVDTNPAKIQNARDIGIRAEFPQKLSQHDFDFIIVAAGSKTAQPLEYALSKVRKRGRIVVIGAVPVELDRNAMYYKEVRVSVSKSYGPGRYDPYYELLGYRYPLEYVRWDIKENMKVFLQFARDRASRLEKIITHEFDFYSAVEAYEKIRKENVIGAVFKYTESKSIFEERKTFEFAVSTSRSNKELSVGVIGAGRFISSFILPHLMKENVNLRIVCNETPESAYNVARRFSFEKYTTSIEEVIKEHPRLVIVGTRHNSHGSIVKKLLEAGISVYVEKPLTIYKEELFEISKIMEENKNVFLYVGFNRRFAELTNKMKDLFDTHTPLTGIIRVNAGKLDKNHWAKIREIGGDRIVGEVGHFVDVAVYLSGSKVKGVYAKSIPEVSEFDDNLHILLKMEDGSLFTILYTEWGSRKLGKEYYEIHQNSLSSVLLDFRELYVYHDNKKRTIRKGPDKGHKNAVKALVDSFRKGVPVIPYDEIFNVTYTTFAIRESLRKGEEITLQEF